MQYLSEVTSQTKLSLAISVFEVTGCYGQYSPNQTQMLIAELMRKMPRADFIQGMEEMAEQHQTTLEATMQEFLTQYDPTPPSNIKDLM